MRKSFTLIELLIVIAIVAVLAVVVILTLNPAQLLRQARDSNRISDLDTINHALSLYQTDQQASIPGATSTVYVSLVDVSTSTCAALGLPILPTGWKYNCATSTANLKNTDGTGWIPVNFKNISSGAPFATLPVDPTNSTSSYYSFIVGQGYQINAQAESDKYAAVETQTSGNPALSAGTNTNLAPFISGLVGWWKFDETGTTALDSSGFGNNGAMYVNTSTVGDLHVAVGCKSGGCGSFDGIGKYVQIANSTSTQPTTMTLSVWVNPSALPGEVVALGKGWYYTSHRPMLGWYSSSYYQFGELSTGNNAQSNTHPATGNWVFISGTYDGADEKIYVNGVLENTRSFVGMTMANTEPVRIGAGIYNGNISYFLTGLIDDARIYNRALSASEILALYNATK